MATDPETVRTIRTLTARLAALEQTVREEQRLRRMAEREAAAQRRTLAWVVSKVLGAMKTQAEADHCQTVSEP